jgi:MerR family mercuric resistance operon transcriptional regulator
MKIPLDSVPKYGHYNSREVALRVAVSLDDVHAEDRSMKRRTIGTLAREAGVNVETVRFYERCGILLQPPSPQEGWREYDEEALALIRYIKQAQHMGFTLAELKRLQTKADGSRFAFCESVRNAAREKMRAIEEQIGHLQTIRQGLEGFLARCTAKKMDEKCLIYETCVRLKASPAAVDLSPRRK